MQIKTTVTLLDLSILLVALHIKAPGSLSVAVISGLLVMSHLSADTWLAPTAHGDPYVTVVCVLEVLEFIAVIMTSARFIRGSVKVLNKVTGKWPTYLKRLKVC